jgi:hypothetical protein
VPNDIPAIVWYVLGGLALIVVSVITGLIYATFGSRNPADNPDSLCSKCAYGSDFPGCPNPDSVGVDTDSGPDHCDSFRQSQPRPTQ